MNRRTFLKASLAGAAVLGSSCRTPRPGPNPSTTSAFTNPLAEPFDREMIAFMAERRIPGGALAVVQDRRLVYAQGYGWANREAQVAATPHSLFRIASVSKPITALAILKLAEERRLDLDAKALPLLALPPNKPPAAPGPGATPLPVQDARLAQITVRHLLHHTGGWDRDVSFDPMFQAVPIARAVGVAPPADAHAVIRYMLHQPLDFDPGSRYAYSNFGYCILGRIIERITGQDYDAFVREKILVPCGIRDMRIGRSLAEGQAPGEVHYYTRDRGATTPVFPEVTGKVPWPYGGFYLEAMDSHGGWIASALDLARLAAALADSTQSPILQPASLTVMGVPPSPPAWRRPDGTLPPAFYGAGWMVRPNGRAGHTNYWHTGSLPGTATLFVRRGDGLSWVALFNQRSNRKRSPDSAIDPALHRAAADVKRWPDHDLFAANHG